MRVVVIYRPQSEHARRVEEYFADFKRFHPGGDIELLNIDTVEGSDFAQVYGVMEYPTLVALKEDGQMQQQWSGVDKLPLMNDLAYYANR